MIQFFILCKKLTEKSEKNENLSEILRQIVDAVNTYKPDIEEVEDDSQD